MAQRLFVCKRASLFAFTFSFPLFPHHYLASRDNSVICPQIMKILMNLKFPLLAVFCVLGLFVWTACEETPAVDPVAKLEAARKAAFEKRPFDPQEIATLASQLSEAYLHRADSLKGTAEAGEDHIRAAELLEEIQQFEQAIAVYDQLISRQPEHPQVAYAMFKKGYDYNLMGDTTQARNFYTDFLQKYPDHEFAPSAKADLQFLGIPLEEWIKIKQKELEDSLARAQTPSN